VDKLEQMLGSYAPAPDGKPYTKNFTEEESPSGMLARSGTYNVRSRVVDDDGEIYAGEYPSNLQVASIVVRRVSRVVKRSDRVAVQNTRYWRTEQAEFMHTEDGHPHMDYKRRSRFEPQSRVWQHCVRLE